MWTSARSLTVLFVLVGCTPAPSALDLEDEELDDVADGELVQIPDGEWAPAAATVTEPEVVPTSDGTMPRYVLGGDGSIDDCFHVAAHGMPAIDVTGTFVATSEEQWLQLTPLHGLVRLQLVDVFDEPSSRSISVVESETDLLDDEAQCRRIRARARKQVAAANAELAAHRWRALEPLAVEYGNPDTPAEAREEIAVTERPLQVIVRHGEAIVRIPGVRVYERHPMRGRPGHSLYAVHGDRESGVVVLTFADCRGDSCTCDPLFTSEVVRWSPATFDALDAHPCSDPEAEDGRCRGIDYGF